MKAITIELTAEAKQHILDKLSQCPDSLGFRLSVKKTGCSGYMYAPEITYVKHDNDVHIVTSEGLNIFIDGACASMIAGSKVDYVKKALGQYQLVFNNPHAAAECGCGESFYLEE